MSRMRASIPIAVEVVWVKRITLGVFNALRSTKRKGKEFVKGISIDPLIKEIRPKSMNTFIDRLSFFQILLIWLFVIISFGLVYYFLPTSESYIYNTPFRVQIDNIIDAVYFSFVASTTAGFGDFIPLGLFKITSIVEIVCAIFLVALVTSKLVSYKQDIILSELYELSLNEKMNRMRASFLLFRQNISRVIVKIEDGSVRKREISELYIHISSFEDTLSEVLGLVKRQGKSDFTIKLDPVNTELMTNSILSSFEKLNELINVLGQHGIEWKRDVTLTLIEKCIGIYDKLFKELSVKSILPGNIFSDQEKLKNQAIETLKDLLK